MRYIDADLIPWTDIAEGTPMKKPIKVLITFADKVNRMPTADVRPNVRGEWIQRGLRGQYHCSNCKHEILTNVYFDNNDVKRLWKFCPNCGADMRGDTE